jgi:hypothetical protein
LYIGFDGIICNYLQLSAIIAILNEDKVIVKSLIESKIKNKKSYIGAFKNIFDKYKLNMLK